MSAYGDQRLVGHVTVTGFERGSWSAPQTHPSERDPAAVVGVGGRIVGHVWYSPLRGTWHAEYHGVRFDKVFRSLRDARSEVLFVGSQF